MREGKRRTHKHWHGRLETYPLAYATRTMALEWQSDRFIQTA